MRLTKLPSWIVPNEMSVEREAAPYRDIPPDQKLRLVEIATRGALQLTRMRPDGLELWELPVDPLPPSTVDALNRLRTRSR